MPKKPATDEDLGYEAARDELAEVVRKLEAGGVPLEESLALWERGEQLAAICQRWLDGARMRIAAAVGDDGADKPAGAGDEEAAGGGPDDDTDSRE